MATYFPPEKQPNELESLRTQLAAANERADAAERERDWMLAKIESSLSVGGYTGGHTNGIFNIAAVTETRWYSSIGPFTFAGSKRPTVVDLRNAMAADAATQPKGTERNRMSKPTYEGPGWYLVRDHGVLWVIGQTPWSGAMFACRRHCSHSSLPAEALASPRLGTDPNVEPQPLRIEAGKWYVCGYLDDWLVGMVTNKTRSGLWTVRLTEPNGGSAGAFQCGDDGMSFGKSWRIIGPHQGPLPWEAKGGAT